MVKSNKVSKYLAMFFYNVTQQFYISGLSNLLLDKIKSTYIRFILTIFLNIYPF